MFFHSPLIDTRFEFTKAGLVAGSFATIISESEIRLDFLLILLDSRFAVFDVVLKPVLVVLNISKCKFGGDILCTL
jgi:hypothetical protein